MRSDTRGPVRIRGALLAVAIGGASTAFAAYFDVAELIPVLGFPYLVWLVRKRFKISAIGAVLGVVSLELLTLAAGVMLRSDGSIFDLIPLTILFIAALIGLGITSVAFLVTGWFSKFNRRRNLISAAAAPLLFILATLAIQPLFFVSREWRKERRWGVNSQMTRTLLRDIDAIAEQLGRVPKDAEELVRLRGKPMPEFRWGLNHTHSLRYHAVDAHHFHLYFGYDMEEWLYDSRDPEKGWQLQE